MFYYLVTDCLNLLMCFFFLMIRRPPRSTRTDTRFPYTTRFRSWDFALFAIGSEATKLYAPKFAAAGCTVIDNSSLYRMDPDVPLIVPEVNPEAIDGYTRRNIIANPNCSTAQMVVALKPLHDAATTKRVVLSTRSEERRVGKEWVSKGKYRW